MNKLYEGLFLMDSNLAAKDWPGLEGHVQEILKKHGAELLHTEKWPDRRLAYEIKGCKKGTYYLTYFNAPSTSIDGMRSDIALSERIIRVMFVSERGLEAHDGFRATEDRRARRAHDRVRGRTGRTRGTAWPGRRGVRVDSILGVTLGTAQRDA